MIKKADSLAHSPFLCYDNSKIPGPKEQKFHACLGFDPEILVLS